MTESWCTVSPPVLQFEISKRSTQILKVNFTRSSGFLKVKTSNPDVIKFVKDVFPFTESIRQVQVQVIYHPELQINFQDTITVFLEELSVNGLEILKVPVKLVHPDESVPEPKTSVDFNLNPSSPTCKICIEEYSESNPPRILTSCGHTVCESCAEGLLRVGEIVCPFDRTSTFVRSAHQLLKNFSLLEMLQDDTNESMNEQGSKFQYHCVENSNHEAVWYCETCHADFCERCFATAHSLKILAGHKKLPASKKPLQCGTHPDSLVEFFCTLEKSGICKQCIETSHKGHFYENFQEKLEKDKVLKLKLEEKAFNLQVEITRVTGCANSFNESHPVFQDNLSLISDFFELKKIAAIQKFKQFGKVQREKCEKEKVRLEEKLKTVREDLKNFNLRDQIEMGDDDSSGVSDSIVSLLDQTITFPEDVGILIV